MGEMNVLENGIIYCTTNLVNAMKYIGQDSRNKSNYLGSGVALSNALKKYGKKNFIKEILQDGIKNIDDLNEAEIYWIDYFGAQKSDLFYNIASGGRSMGNMGEDVNAKISYGLIGRIMSPETRRKIGDTNRAEGYLKKPRIRCLKQDVVGNWGICLKVVKIISASLLKIGMPIVQIDVISGECIEWPSTGMVSKKFNCDNKSINNNCIGRCSQYKNFFWLFKYDIISGRINWDNLLWNYEKRDYIPSARPKIYREDIFNWILKDKKKLRTSEKLDAITISKILFRENKFI